MKEDKPDNLPGESWPALRFVARQWAIRVVTVGLGFAVPLLMLEGLFRILPVSSLTNTQPVNEHQPYIHYEENREITFSRGWNFALVTKKRVNNVGYLSDFDFSKDATGPLVVIIGDSYVEAMQVANRESMHGHLAEKVKNRGRVYGIGYSGSALSQYLAFAQFASGQFSPAAMVIVVVGNDFDESLEKYKWDPGFHYFREENGALVLRRIDFDGHSGFRELARHSALMRYLFLTVGIDWRRLVGLWSPGEVGQLKYVGNTAADASAERLRDSRRAVDAFLHSLPGISGLPPARIAFVVDAMRPNLYSERGMKEAADSYFDLMRTDFMNAARDMGYEVIDMQVVFERHYAHHGKKFEFPTDAHWNALGHEVVAEEIARSQVFQAVFGKTTSLK